MHRKGAIARDHITRSITVSLSSARGMTLTLIWAWGIAVSPRFMSDFSLSTRSSARCGSATSISPNSVARPSAPAPVDRHHVANPSGDGADTFATPTGAVSVKASMVRRPSRSPQADEQRHHEGGSGVRPIVAEPYATTDEHRADDHMSEEKCSVGFERLADVVRQRATGAGAPEVDGDRGEDDGKRASVARRMAMAAEQR